MTSSDALGTTRGRDATRRETLTFRLETMVRTVVALVVLPLALGAVAAWALVLARLGAARERIDRIYSSYARLGLWVGGTKVLASGLEHIRPGQAYVVVSNHQSNWDSVVLFGVLPLPLRVVIKDQVARIPIFGRALLATGNVRVDRSNTASDVAAIGERMAERPPEVSMLFYAEGRRSRDDTLQPFKMGAFATALRFGLPVLPVALVGTHDIWAPDTLRLRRGVVRMEVGEPIPVDGMTIDDRHALRDRSRERVEELRARAGMRPSG